MDDRPYTTPEEDPFNVTHTVQLCPNPRRRKSSLLNKWIQEQQQRCADHPAHIRSQSTPLTNPYLAYPELGRSDQDRPSTADPTAIRDSAYDLVDDNDIPPRLAAQLAEVKLADNPTTIRSNSKRCPRMALSPSSFRPFNVFRSPSADSPTPPTEENTSRPSSRLSLFTRTHKISGGSSTSRSTVTPHPTPQKRAKRASYNAHQTPSPRRSSPSSWRIRPHTTSSKWRPTVLGHFGDPDLAAPAASQTSIQPPPSDSVSTPSRPSLSSSADGSHTHTSLTVPSVDGASLTHQSPTSEEQKQCPFTNVNARPQTQTQTVRPRSDSKRYSTPGAGTGVPTISIPQPQFQNNRGSSTFTSASSVSLRSAYPSSVNTNTNVFGSSDRELVTPSPTQSSPLNSRPGASPVTGPYGVGQYPRMLPFVYTNGVQSQPGSIGSKRSGNAFDAIPSAWRYNPSSPASAGYECDVDDGDDDFFLGSSCSWAMSDSQQPPRSCQQQLSPPQCQKQQELQQHELDKKKKPHVVYSQGSSGGTLSKMTSFSNLALPPMMMARNKKKKKRLVVSGVAANDVKKFEGVKKWCESFGEVRQIIRMPNGDLVVSYQSADVADTVCRVRAKVFINGVGSVQLSWTTEKKR